MDSRRRRSTGAVEPVAPRSGRERTRRRTAALRVRAQRVAARAESERRRHASLDALLATVDRDDEVAGGILAGALAYRLFIWLLPFALVLVAGLGIGASAASSSPESAARSLGVAGLVSGSVAAAAKDPTRWYALLVGLPALYLATRSVLRALIGAHRLVWADVRTGAPRPTAGATARLLGLLLCLFALTGLADAARARAPGLGVAIVLVLVVPYAGLWLLVSLRLPHRGADARSLLPGAAVFAVGLVLLHVAAAYLIGPLALTKQGTYGALGVAAALLLGLFGLSRVVVGAAVLNATLWERRSR